MTLNLCGQVFGTSGYASHTRQLFNALYQENPLINLEPILPNKWELLANDAELTAIMQEHFDDGVTVFIGQPFFWDSVLVRPHSRFYGFVVWEGERIPHDWLAHLLKADGLLVPSTHVKDAIMRTARDEDKLYPVAGGEAIVKADAWLAQKLYLVPHGVDTSLFVPSEVPVSPFTFLANKGWNRGEWNRGEHDRGGIQHVLRAFTEEFRAGEEVQLKIKLNPAYPAPGGWRAAVDALGCRRDSAPVSISDDEVEYKAMPQFYKGHVFVSGSMAEGFNIPCLEAMSCGVPVITTAYGGQLDYVNEGNGWLVPGELFGGKTEGLWLAPRLLAGATTG